MNRYIKNISYLLFIPLILVVWLVKADYYQQLKVIESKRLSNLSFVKKSLVSLEEQKDDFNQEEQHLFKLLKAHSETMNSNFGEAETLLLELIESNASANYKGRAHSILAAILQLQGRYVDSFLNLDKALALTPSMDNSAYKANILQNALSFYNDAGMLDYAMDFARRLLKHGITSKDIVSQCQAHFEIAVIELSAGKIDLADNRLDTSYKICEQANKTLFLLYLPNIKAKIAMQRGDLATAKKLLEGNYPKVDGYDWKILESSTEILLAEVYFGLEEYSKALSFAHKAMEVSSEIGDLKRTKNATKVLAKAYTETDEKGKAIKYYQRYMELEQQLSSSSSQRRLAYDQARQQMRTEYLAGR